MTSKSMRGRKGGQTTIKQLTVLLGALSQSHEPIQTQGVANKLGISYDEAQRLMDMLVDVAGDETSYLPLACGQNDDELELISSHTPVKPLRLTKAESIALLAALQTSGFDDASPLYQLIQHGYAQPTTNAQEIARTVASAHTLTNSDVLLGCIKALMSDYCLAFTYASQHSNTTKNRLVFPYTVYVQDGFAYLEAYEFASDQFRTFRLDRISNLQHKAPVYPQGQNEQGKNKSSLAKQALYKKLAAHKKNNEQVVATTTITLLDPQLEELYPWHPIQRTQHDDTSVELVIPNYGSPWLIRHLAACGRRVKIKDPNLAKKVSDYAQDLLAKQLKQRQQQ